MVYIKRPFIKIIIFFLLLSGIAFNVLAQGFSMVHMQALTSKIKEKYDPNTVAKKLSDLDVKTAWKGEMDADLALYVAAHWFNQNHLNPCEDLLDKIDPQKTDEDLWQYYRAMTYLNLNQFKKSQKYIQNLELKRGTDVDVVILKSTFLAHANLLIDAIKYVGEYMRKNKKDGYAYFQRGYLHLLSLSNELALEDFKRAVKYLPKSDIRKRQQAMFQASLIHQKYFMNEKKAVSWFKKGKDLDPHSELVQQISQQFWK